MTRQTFQFHATVTSEDGTQDNVVVTFEYPENRAVSLLGLVEQLGNEANSSAIKRSILTENLSDASVLALIMKADADGDLDDD
jgi:uncharacterized membrane protein YcgQ (UPF0703/DUF1980 family)